MKFIEPSPSYINLIWNNYECKTLFIIRPVQYDLIASKFVELIKVYKMHCCHERRDDVTDSCRKCNVVCGTNIIQ